MVVTSGCRLLMPKEKWLQISEVKNVCTILTQSQYKDNLELD